jgi:hypothetical protein
MKTRDEVIALFRDKYEYLKTVYPSVGPFEESRLYQNPDGGWQMNLENWAAITLRPGDDKPHEIHGAICARWYKDGGAFDEDGIPGWLGYPTSDEVQLKQDGVENRIKNLAGWMEWGTTNCFACSRFQGGEIYAFDSRRSPVDDPIIETDVRINWDRVTVPEDFKREARSNLTAAEGIDPGTLTGHALYSTSYKRFLWLFHPGNQPEPQPFERSSRHDILAIVDREKKCIRVSILRGRHINRWFEAARRGPALFPQSTSDKKENALTCFLHDFAEKLGFIYPERWVASDQFMKISSRQTKCLSVSSRFHN